MASGADRLVRQQLERKAEEVSDWPEATVTAITVGGGKDGQDLVTVSYAGGSYNFSHYAHYTPAVGHVVTLIRVSGNWAIFGRRVGFP